MLTKNKLLEPKDILEVAFYYKLLKLDQVYQLIHMMFDDTAQPNEMASRYPISLYKVLVEYE